MIWFLLFVALVLHGVDWLQTRWISVYGAERGIYETNIFLGMTPSLRRVDVYFLVTALALSSLLEVLQETPAGVAFFLWALIELFCVVRNFKLGVKLFLTEI